ncbi:MAG: cold-shock protein [Alistipes sp.]|nr:cold-shock protein [Alistipes sp.]
MVGKVKWFDSKKGYGFILTDEGREVFVHYTGIVAEGFKALTEGQNVEFEIGSNDKGVQAVNVTVVPRKE